MTFFLTQLLSVLIVFATYPLLLLQYDMKPWSTGILGVAFLTTMAAWLPVKLGQLWYHSERFGAQGRCLKMEKLYGKASGNEIPSGIVLVPTASTSVES